MTHALKPYYTSGRLNLCTVGRLSQMLERGILELILYAAMYDHSDIFYFSYRLHVADAVHRCDITVTYIHPYVSAVSISVLYAVCVPAVAGVQPRVAESSTAAILRAVKLKGLAGVRVPRLRHFGRQLWPGCAIWFNLIFVNTKN